MKNSFIFESNRRLGGQINMKVDLSFNEAKIANIGYGFNPHYYDCSAKEPGMPTEKYRLHSSITPRKGDTFTHIKSGRVFQIGKSEGFLLYTVPLLENEKEVAKIAYEDYYKD